MRVLTRNIFKEWLEDKQPNELVGRIGDPDSCPLATCLHEKGAIAVSVSDGCSYTKGPTKFLLERKWITDFIARIDSLKVLPPLVRKEMYENEDDQAPEVDAATCLKTLKLRYSPRKKLIEASVKKAFETSVKKAFKEFQKTLSETKVSENIIGDKKC